MPTNEVPLLETPDQVADWLDQSYPMDLNQAAFNRIDDHLGSPVRAIKLWSAGAHLLVGQRHPTGPDRATCTSCGRSVRLVDGRLEAHTVPGLYDRPCHQDGA